MAPDEYGSHPVRIVDVTKLQIHQAYCLICKTASHAELVFVEMVGVTFLRKILFYKQSLILACEPIFILGL